MLLPVKLHTKYGKEQFDVLANQFKHYSDMGKRDLFKERCAEDLKIQRAYLSYFLDDEIMSKKYPMTDDDVSGWGVYHAQADVVRCLKYFSGKAY